MRWSGRAVALLVLLALLGVTLSGLGADAFAQPSPPPNPGDEELRRSQDGVAERAGVVGRLTTELAELDSRTDDIQAALAADRETAEAALLDFLGAQSAAAAAAQRAAQARVETEAATVAIDSARVRVDEVVTATYLEGLDLGPLALLTDATSPEDLLARVEADEVVARSLLGAQEGLERARVAKANADSSARAALDEARDREAEAQAAKVVADGAVVRAETAAREQAERLATVDAQRAQVQRQLADAEAADAGLRGQRARYNEWLRQTAAEQAARDRAEQQAAAARLAGNGGPAVGAGTGSVRRVIDRAMSQLGVQYVWGGGNGRGPSRGIPDAFGSPLNRVGFDCSGLMLYAFNGAGVGLPRVSRNQFNAGRKVPVSDLQPGDMVFYRNGGGPIHHVAMFIGNGKMIEAPYTGANVRVTPLRTRGLLPEATRML